MAQMLKGYKSITVKIRRHKLTRPNRFTATWKINGKDYQDTFGSRRELDRYIADKFLRNTRVIDTTEY